MKTVAVIGAGFTGTLTALRLLAGGARVVLINRYPLAAAAEAHRALESRQTSGPIVLLP